MCLYPYQFVSNILEAQCDVVFFLIFIYFSFIFGCAGSSSLCGLSPVAVSGSALELWCVGFSFQWLLWL